MSRHGDFSLCPRQGKPRLLRMLTAWPYGPEQIARLNAGLNLLEINEPLFAQLSKTQQEQLIRTQAAVVEHDTPVAA